MGTIPQKTNTYRKITQHRRGEAAEVKKRKIQQEDRANREKVQRHKRTRNGGPRRHGRIQ